MSSINKKILILGLSSAMIFGSANAFAEDDITVTLNGSNLTFDVPPQIINDRTMVPLRAIFEALGAEVSWDNDTRTVTSVKSGTTVKMTIDSTEMYVNGKSVTLDTPAQIVSDRTLVPVRAIAESFGADVDWNSETRTVIIESAEQVSTTEPTATAEPVSTIESAGISHYAGTVLPDFGAVASREQASVEPPTGRGTSLTHRYEYTASEKDSREADIEKYITVLTDSGWMEDTSAAAVHTNPDSRIFRSGTASVEIFTNDSNENYYVCVIDLVSQKSAYKNTDVLDFGVMSGAVAADGSDSDYAYTFADASAAETAVTAYRADLERFYWTAYTDHGIDGTIYKLTSQNGDETAYSRRTPSSESDDVVYIRAEGNTVYVRPSVCIDDTDLANYVYFTSYSNKIDETSAKYNETDFDLYMKFAYNAKYENDENVTKFESASSQYAQLPHMYMWEKALSQNEWGYIYYRFSDTDATVTVRSVCGTYDDPDAAAAEEILSRLTDVSEELERIKPLKENADFAKELADLTDCTYRLLEAAEPYDGLSDEVKLIKESWENLYSMCESGSTDKFNLTASNIELVASGLKSDLK